jgi:hypothetical protein
LHRGERLLISGRYYRVERKIHEIRMLVLDTKREIIDGIGLALFGGARPHRIHEVLFGFHDG